MSYPCLFGMRSMYKKKITVRYFYLKNKIYSGFDINVTIYLSSAEKPHGWLHITVYLVHDLSFFFL